MPQIFPVFIVFIIPTNLLASYTTQLKEFYDPLIDHIEVLDSESFSREVLHSNKATVLQYYADWCGYSKKFVPHWKQFANETRLWHKYVVRVAVMNCALEVNDQICWKNYVVEFPQFAFYHARAKNSIGTKKEDENSRSEKFMRTTIDFLEKQRHPPKEWPKLLPYISDLESIFETDRDMKYIILIFEPEDSYLGRKLILDFTNYLEHIIIRRVAPKTNPYMFRRFDIRENITQPEFYLITNTPDSNKKFEKFDDFVTKMSREKEHNEVDESILQNNYGIEQTIRYKYMKMIFDFIKFNDLEFDFNEMDL